MGQNFIQRLRLIEADKRMILHCLDLLHLEKEKTRNHIL